VPPEMMAWPSSINLRALQGVLQSWQTIDLIPYTMITMVTDHRLCDGCAMWMDIHVLRCKVRAPRAASLLRMHVAPVAQRPRVGDDLLLVLHELGAARHLERHSQAGDGVVVRPALETREHGLVDLRP